MRVFSKTFFHLIALLAGVAVQTAVAGPQIGDLDGDGDIDLQDHLDFTSCMLGPGSGLARGCNLADIDSDHDVDLSDWIEFENHFGETVLPPFNGPLFPGAMFTVGPDPRSIATADFDGDGDIDIATANNNNGGTGNVSVLLNPGNGMLADHVTYAPGSAVIAVAAGDLDGDYDIDLAVVHSNPSQSLGNLIILLNDGDGSFVLDDVYAVGHQPNSIVIRDLDGDDHPDLAVANGGMMSNSISVLRNIGNGAFEAQVPYPAGTEPISLIASDLDGDADIDLAATSNEDSVVSVLKNNGNGIFAPLIAFEVGDSPTSLVAGDIDGDDDIDLAVATYYDGISILVNESNRTFVTPAIELSFWQPARLAFGDLDSDGDLDLAVLDTSPQANITSLLNNGTGAFSAQEPYYAGIRALSIALGDLNGDGIQDLVVGQSEVPSPTGQVLTMWGDDLGGFATQQPYEIRGNDSNPRTVAMGDFDGDNDIDLAVASGTLIVLPNSGDGTFPVETPYPAGTGVTSVAAGDLDGDGDIDLVVTNDGSPQDGVSILQNNGNGVFSFIGSYSLGSHAAPASIVLGDLDNDGDLDLTVGKQDTTFSTLKNMGNGTFATHALWMAGNGSRSLTLADLDGDLDLDVAIANYAGNTISVRKNNGDGTFAPRVEFMVGTWPSSVAAGDLDSDGDLDLVAANEVSDSFSILENNGDGTFNAQVAYAAGDGPYGVVIGDWDNDGDLDIAAGNSESMSISILLRQGDGTYSAYSQYASGYGPGFIAVGDLDGDTDLDLVTANIAFVGWGPGTISVSHNLRFHD